MRIAFDLDGTLIPAPGSPMLVEPLRWLPRIISREPIRVGTPKLLRGLSKCGHEIWLYTTSLRNPARLRLWFGSFGVRLDGVINQTRHDALLSGKATASSKYPPAFGIDLLVDDSKGVEIEGRRFGFSVMQIEPDDIDWVAKVERMVEEFVARTAV
jgi:hypothetical protein